MANSMLQTLGDLVRIQNKYNMKHFGGNTGPGFVQCLLTEGELQFGDPYSLANGRSVQRLKDLAYECKILGLEVTEEETDWYNNVANCKGYRVKIKLPISPALEILYGKSPTR